MGNTGYEHIGEKYINTQGLQFEIVDWIDKDNVTVCFDDDTIKEGCSYSNIKKGICPNPSIKPHIGEKHTNNQGIEFEIIDYISFKEITIRFSDGTVKEGCQYSNIIHGNCPHPTIKPHVGERFKNKQNKEYEIIEYKDANNVTVQFNDGMIKENCKYAHIIKGICPYPKSRIEDNEGIDESEITPLVLKDINTKTVSLMDHNKKACEKIIKKYNNGNNKICYVSGTGTGKSYVYMALLEKILEQIDGKVLYIMPKNSVGVFIQKYKEFDSFKDRVDFVTYNTFSTSEKTKEVLDKYSQITIDEMHHLGSDIYGFNLIKYMKNSKKRFFLGLTATPKREDGVDTSKYFDARVDGISIFDSIRKGLMPEINYEILNSNYKVEDYKSLMQDKDYKYNYDFQEVCKVLKNYFKTDSNKRDKWIVYFRTIEELENAKVNIKEVFPEYKVFTVYSKLDNLNEFQQELDSYEKYIILSVSIFLEGTHIEGIEGVLLFRNVTSALVFQQMMGRIMKIGQNYEPLFIDCSYTAGILYASLINENIEANREVNNRDRGENKEKTPWKISVNGIAQYDIMKLLQMLNPTAFDKIEMQKNSVEAYKHYLEKGGKYYATEEELRSQKREDYKIALAMCRFHGTNIRYFINTMLETGE